jgi:hypothetical protein
MKGGALVVLSLVLVTSFFTLNTTLFTKASAASQTNGFNVINSAWGTSASPQSAAPGDKADILTVTLQYIYTATAETVETYLELPNGFSVYNGSSVAYATTTGTYPTGATIQLSYPINLASTLSLGSYVIPMDISWTAAGYAYYLNDTIQVTVQVEGRPQIQVSYAPGSSLTAGEVNDVSFVVSNNGSGTASDISLSANTQTGGVLNTLPQIQSLSVGGSTLETAQVYVPASSAGSVFTLSISGKYEDPYGNSQTMSQSLNVYVPISSTEVYNATLSIIPLNDSVITAENSKVDFKIENIGGSTVEKPVVTLSVTSPLIILSNSTVGYSNSIAPGGSTMYEATVTSSPSATLGAYSGTLSILYYDQSGNEHTAQFAVGFVLTGTIALTAESETVSQSTRTLSVSGSLLNEGTASAYYASVVACVIELNTTQFRTTTTSTTTSSVGAGATTTTTVSRSTSFTRTFSGFNGSFSGFPGGLGQGLGGATTAPCPATSTSSYIGEIDPNSPVAYTAAATYNPSNSSSIATLVLVITYKNSFGTTATQPIDKIVNLTPASSGTTNPTTTTRSPGHLYVDIAMYGVIIAIVASAIAGGIYVRRNKRSIARVDEKVV